MLNLTTTAFAEHRAERLRPFGRRRRQPVQPRHRILRLDFGDAHDRAFARQRTEAKHDQTIVTADGLSVCEKVVKVEFEPIPSPWGAGPVSRRVARQAF
jgi:hypothetical protein